MLNINTPEELVEAAVEAYNMTECTGCTKYFEELIKINADWWTPESAESVAKNHKALNEMMKDASLAAMVYCIDEDFDGEIGQQEYEFAD